tara:strand:+ start:363 stop:551 length:189 start_codon:yes stop_codon:yes gene_type:complete
MIYLLIFIYAYAGLLIVILTNDMLEVGETVTGKGGGKLAVTQSICLVVAWPIAGFVMMVNSK